MRRTQEQIRKELEQIKGRRELLMPEEVVQWAHDHPDSALHGSFDWDDTEAARKYRIWQARQIISFNVIKEHGVRQFISLTVDRVRGGGYRNTQSVARHKEMREVMLADALGELKRIKEKYRHLVEFAAVFAEIDKADRRYGRSKKAA